MKVSCDVIRDLLPLYTDQAASADTVALVEEHLASCPACREELGRLGTALPAEPEGVELPEVEPELSGLPKAEQLKTQIQPPSSSINEPELIVQNPGYKFWLSIPGTAIDYPVVQHEDNQYYLTHDFFMKEQINGSIFADCSSIPLAADNTVLYGHNMKDRFHVCRA